MNPALEQLTEQFTRLVGAGGAVPTATKVLEPVVAPAAVVVPATVAAAAPAVATGTPAPAVATGTSAPAPAVTTGTPAPAAPPPPPPPSPVQTVDHARKGYHFDATIASAQVVVAAEILDQHGFALDTITGVDWLAQGEMEVVYDFFHPTSPLRVVVRTRVPRANPELPTILKVFPGANWHERETHDFFGIRFSGHPNLKPFLLPEDADFHPLRKDYQP